MNDHDVIGKLRGAALGGPPATVETAAAVAARGRTLRRRRRVASGIGGGAGLGVVVIVALLAGSSTSSSVVQQLPSVTSPSPATTARAIDPGAHDANLERLRAALGRKDWRITADDGDEDVLALDQASTAGRGLPAGYSATGHIDSEPAFTRDLKCDKHSNPKFVSCEVRQETAGHDLRIIRNKFITDERAASASTFVDYVRPDGFQVTAWLDIDQPRGSKAGADWRQAEAWLQQFEDQLIAAAADPRIEPEKLTTNDGLFNGVQQLARPCSPDAIKVEIGATPEDHRNLFLELRNVSSTTCRLQGFPTVTLFDARHNAIAFTYRDADGAVPAVSIEPGDLADVGLSKAACAAGELNRAVSITFALPDNSTPSAVDLPVDHDLGWCGAGDPGSTITVSPIQGTGRATPAPH